MNSLVKFSANQSVTPLSAGALDDLTDPSRSVDADTSAIVVENLCKKYGTHWAVDEVNFIVPRGWTVGVLGGNGAGKTTMISMIMGLVLPTFGRAMVLGHDMATERHKVLPPDEFRKPLRRIAGKAHGARESRRCSAGSMVSPASRRGSSN